MTRPNARVTRQSVFPVEANVATVGASKHGSNTTHGATTKQKRKRPVSDPADAIALSAKRPRGNTPPMVIEHPYAPTAPKATGGIFSPTDAAVTKKIFIPYGSLG